MLRTLDSSDEEKVITLSGLLWKNDYLPDRFVSRVNDPYWTFVGLFDKTHLIGIIALQRVPDTEFAWVKSLRVHPDHQRQGNGLLLLNHIIKQALSEGCIRLFYATGSANKPSNVLAQKSGFKLAERSGYFRLEPPYPPHPKPSPVIHPLEVDAQRMAEILEEQPSIAPTSFLPYAWNFEMKNVAGLQRMSSNTTFHAVLNEKGIVDAIFFNSVHERNDMKTSSHTIFSLEKSIFIDSMSRILDELVNSDFERSAFFLGPNAMKWAPNLLVIPEVYTGRSFLLYEMQL